MKTLLTLVDSMRPDALGNNSQSPTFPRCPTGSYQGMKELS